MTRILILALAASPAFAGSERIWPGTAASGFRPAIVRLHAPTDPRAVASVTFENTTVHQGNETFQLDLDGLVIDVTVTFQAAGDAEAITVLPPPGYLAIPETITVPEDQQETLHIIKYEGM